MDGVFLPGFRRGRHAIPGRLRYVGSNGSDAFLDAITITGTTAADCNRNSVPDEFDLAPDRAATTTAPAFRTSARAWATELRRVTDFTDIDPFVCVW